MPSFESRSDPLLQLSLPLVFFCNLCLPVFESASIHSFIHSFQVPALAALASSDPLPKVAGPASFPGSAGLPDLKARAPSLRSLSPCSLPCFLSLTASSSLAPCLFRLSRARRARALALRRHAPILPTHTFYPNLYLCRHRHPRRPSSTPASRPRQPGPPRHPPSGGASPPPPRRSPVGRGKTRRRSRLPRRNPRRRLRRRPWTSWLRC